MGYVSLCPWITCSPNTLTRPVGYPGVHVPVLLLAHWVGPMAWSKWGIEGNAVECHRVSHGILGQDTVN